MITEKQEKGLKYVSEVFEYFRNNISYLTDREAIWLTEIYCNNFLVDGTPAGNVDLCDLKSFQEQTGMLVEIFKGERCNETCN